MDIRLVRHTVGSRPVLDVSGELDLATVPRLHGELASLVAEAAGDADAVVVDLDGVTSLDDTALGVLLGAAGRAREAGGELVVVCNDERLTNRFASTGFDRAIVVVASVHALDR